MQSIHKPLTLYRLPLTCTVLPQVTVDGVVGLGVADGEGLGVGVAASRVPRSRVDDGRRRDGHHPIIAMQCGPIRHEIDRHTARSGAQLSLRIVRRDTTPCATKTPRIIPGSSAGTTRQVLSRWLRSSTEGSFSQRKLIMALSSEVRVAPDSLISCQNFDVEKRRDSATVAPAISAGNTVQFNALPWNIGRQVYITSSLP